MVSFTINEPHPTVAKGHYIHSGRGGAGNYFRAPATTPSTGVPMKVTPSNTTASSTASRRYFSGRGGAGNMHTGPEAHLVDFEEEFTRAQHREQNPVGHVGRGGAGNCYKSAAATSEHGVSSRRSSADSDASSSASHRISGFFARLSGTSLH